MGKEKVDVNKFVSISEILQKLQATGWIGFEGFVATLLSELTGYPMLLACSGLQSGLDSGTSRKNGIHIAVECKRYHKNTPLSQRELIAEIHAAIIADPKLDCWILATTRSVTVQEESILEAECQERGIEYLSLGCAALPNVGHLDALCATHSASAVEFLKSAQVMPSLIKEFEQTTEILAAKPETTLRVKELQHHLSAPNLGFSIFRDKLNRRLSVDLSDPLRCKYRFRCALGPHALPDGLISVPRPLFRKQLQDLWIDANSSSELSAAVVLGDEGDGKSWLVADWILDLISTPDAPAVFFFAARETSPSITATLRSHVHNYADVKESCDVQRLFGRWLSNVQQRRAVVVFDGLNERLDRALWSDLVASALQEYGTSIFLVLTCRQQTWKIHYRPAMLHSLTEITIGPFDDQEFLLALRQLPEQSRSALLELGALVRRPRYFHCACEHAHKLNSTHDLSIPLLYYLDWSHRQSRRPLLSLNAYDFEQGLMELAKRQHEAMRDSHQTEVADALGNHEFRQHLEELSSGGVLRRSVRLGRWQVEEPFLALGLGMYLASLLEERGGGIDDRCELASVTLGDTSSWDLTGDVMQQALQHALHASPPFSLETQVAVFTVWTQCLNSVHQAAQSLPKLAAFQPELVFTFADRTWRIGGTDHLVETAVLEALVRIMRCPDHQALALKWLCHWTGAVHQFGESGREDSDPEIPRHADVDRLCCEGTCVLPSSQIALRAVPKRTDIRLGRLALAALSACDRKIYWQALVTGIVASEIMGGNRTEELGWIVRSSAQPIDDLVDATVTVLLKDRDVICDRSARRLLKFLGSPALIHRLDEIPPDPAPWRHPCQDEYDAEPCSSFFLAPPRRVFINCLSRADVPYHILAERAKALAADRDVEFPDRFGARVCFHAHSVDVNQLHLSIGQTSEDLKWQRVEPLLCRIDPDLFASIIKRFAITAMKREDVPLRQLSVSIREYPDVLGPEEVEELYSAWQLYVASPGFPDSKDALFVEGNLAEAILPHFTAVEQYDFLRARPCQARELLSLEKFFKQFSLEEQTFCLGSVAEAPRDVRIALWFLSGQIEINEDVAVALIKAALRGNDTAARGLGLELLHRLDRSAWLGIEELQSGAYENNASCVERFYGTSMVMLTSLPSAESLARCCKVHMGAVLTAQNGPYSTLWDTCYAELLIRKLRIVATDAPVIPEHPNIDMNTGNKRHPWVRISISGSRDKSVHFMSPMSSWGGLAPGGFEEFDAVFKHRNEDDSAAHEALNVALDEAVSQGDWLFGSHIPIETVERIIKVRPSFIDEFEAILRLAQVSHRIRRIQPVLEALTAWGLRTGLQVAERWFDILEMIELPVKYTDSLTGLRSRGAALLAAPVSPSIESRWRSALEETRSDHELYLTIFTLSMNGHQQWLRDEAIRQLQSQSPRGRALCISIFAALAEDDQSLHDQLIEFLGACPSWYSELMEFARQYRQRGEDYRYWLKESIAHEDAVMRVRAARLALHIEDNRASQILNQLWSDESLTMEARERLHRVRPLYERNSRSEWAKKLDGRLFGFKKLEHNVAPWLPLPEELQQQ